MPRLFNDVLLNCVCCRNGLSQHLVWCTSQKAPRPPIPSPTPCSSRHGSAVCDPRSQSNPQSSGILAPIDNQRADSPRVLWSPSVISAASEPGAGGDPEKMESREPTFSSVPPTTPYLRTSCVDTCIHTHSCRGHRHNPPPRTETFQSSSRSVSRNPRLLALIIDRAAGIQRWPKHQRRGS